MSWSSVLWSAVLLGMALVSYRYGAKIYQAQWWGIYEPPNRARARLA